MVYVLSGMLAAIAGHARVVTWQRPTLGVAEALLLPSVAAAVIGGTSIFGGRGGYTGSIVGATHPDRAGQLADRPRRARADAPDHLRRDHPRGRGRIRPRDQRVRRASAIAHDARLAALPRHRVALRERVATLRPGDRLPVRRDAVGGVRCVADDGAQCIRTPGRRGADPPRSRTWELRRGAAGASPDQQPDELHDRDASARTGAVVVRARMRCPQSDGRGGGGAPPDR